MRSGRYGTCCRYNVYGRLVGCATTRYYLKSSRKTKDIIRCVRNGRYGSCCRYNVFGRLVGCATTKYYLRLKK